METLSSFGTADPLNLQQIGSVTNLCRKKKEWEAKNAKSLQFVVDKIGKCFLSVSEWVNPENDRWYRVYSQVIFRGKIHKKE